MTKDNATDAILEHRDIISRIFIETDESYPKTHKRLLKELPGFKQGFQTFRSYWRVIGAMLPKLDTIRAELDKAQAELSLTNEKLDKAESERQVLKTSLSESKAEFVSVKAELGKLGNARSEQQSFVIDNQPVAEPKSKRLLGWTLRRNNKGYIHAYRRFNTKLHCVYLGKAMAGAEDKIRLKEKELDIPPNLSEKGTTVK